MQLTSYEEKILKYLIKNFKKSNESIDIPESVCEASFAIDALNEMEKYGLVKPNIALNSVSAFITEKGYVFFDELKKEEYGEYYDSIKMVDELIDKVDEALKCPTKEKTFDIVNILTSCFWKDIPKESFMYFNTYSHDEMSDKNKQIQDLELCKLHLRKIKGSLLIKAKEMKEEHLKIVNQIQMSQTQSTELSIDISNSFEVINESNSFTADEKLELISLLNEIKKEKSKESKNNKIKSIISKIIDKGVDAVIACAPVMIQALTNIK